MVIRASGTAIPVRITMIAVATINSISVKPLALRRCAVVARSVLRTADILNYLFRTNHLLYVHDGLSAIDGDRLHGRIARSAAGNCERRLPAGLSHER